MRKSNIFEDFIKIAQNQGLISKAAEQTEKTVKNPRWDSLSIEQISKLYGVKPDAPDDMTYKRNIIEDAHPESVIISPAYDRINGLVENNNERQDIILHILHKTPDGQLTNKKYAEKQLILSLVKAANDLDNHNEEQLRVLADTCLVQVTQSTIKKEAWVVPVLLIAALLGAIYLKQHTAFHSDGFEMDYQKAMSELDDFLSNSINLGVGHTYRPEFIQLVNDLKAKLNAFHTSYSNVIPLLDSMDAPKTGKELLELQNHPKTQEVVEQVKKFKEEAQNLYPYIAKIMKDFSNPAFKQRQVTDKGVFNSLVEGVPGLMGGSNLVADDFDDVVHALTTVMNDITNIMHNVQGANSIEEQAKQDLVQFNQEMPTEKEVKPEPEAQDKTSPWEDLEKEVGGSLFGH